MKVNYPLFINSVEYRNNYNKENLMNIHLLLLPLKVGHAYLDPGTGSFLLQLLIAAFLGATFLFRNYIGRFFRYIRNLFIKSEENKDDEQQ